MNRALSSGNWRRLRDTIVLLLILAATLKAMQHLGMLYLGSGNATAKDGDSLVLNETEVRLYGIDAPELHQTCDSPGGEYACGREALQALRTLLTGRTITCTVRDTDRYGRAVSVCRDGDLEINREMVRRGWAVAYTRHALSYVADERDARTAGRGIWQGRFETPEKFRERLRNQTGLMAGETEDD